jgi:enterochelin esterase family protein
MSVETRRDAPVGRARTIPPQAPRLVPPEVATSPRVVALTAAVVAGDAVAVVDFWRAVAEEGTPLIEASDDDPHTGSSPSSGAATTTRATC